MSAYADADVALLSQGPVMAENLGEPVSKEDLKARAQELNK